MGYFCKTCQLAICSDCAMFGTEVRNNFLEYWKLIYMGTYSIKGTSSTTYLRSTTTMSTKLKENHKDFRKGDLYLLTTNSDSLFYARLKELTTHLNTVESTIDKLKKAKEEKVSELTVTLEQARLRICERLSEQYVVDASKIRSGAKEQATRFAPAKNRVERRD